MTEIAKKTIEEVFGDAWLDVAAKFSAQLSQLSPKARQSLSLTTVKQLMPTLPAPEEHNAWVRLLMLSSVGLLEQHAWVFNGSGEQQMLTSLQFQDLLKRGKTEDEDGRIWQTKDVYYGFRAVPWDVHSEVNHESNFSSGRCSNDESAVCT